MIVEFDVSFEKSIFKLKDRLVAKKVLQLIENFEHARTISEIPNIKKLKGFAAYYRVRVGDYRIGLEKTDERTIRLIIICHLKDIYRLFT
jgi:mRNA interferase RelE/StbE